MGDVRARGLVTLTASDSNRLKQHSTSGALSRRTRTAGAGARTASAEPGERGGVGGGVLGGAVPCSAEGDCGLRRTWRTAPAMPRTSGAACMHATAQDWSRECHCEGSASDDSESAILEP